MMIKICGLKTRDDVASAIDAGADAIGFVFAKSVRQVTPAEALDACHSVSDDVRRVAVMKQPSQALLDEVLEVFSPDVVQTDIEDFANLSFPATIETWPVFRQGVSAPHDEPAFLYEGKKSGAGETVDWAEAATHTTTGNMILAGGLAPDNVTEAIKAVRPWGVDVSSGVESSPGVKDASRISAFIQAARAAETTA